MSKRMLIDATHREEVRVAVVDDEILVDFDFENISRKPLKGNVYLAKIVRIEPSLQAAFVDYGGGRHGFLAFTEIHPDYFRIPVADRPKNEETEEEAPLEAAKDPLLPIAESAPQGGDDARGEAETEEVLESLLENKDTGSQEPEDSLKTDPIIKTNPYRTYKIQEVIHSRQVVLVQVVKEERGNKGAALTTYISLAGRYCVLMPNAASGGGVSRRITDVADRQRLKNLMQDLDVPSGMSLIVRTAGLDRSKTEIKRDYTYLMKLWGQIREQTLKAMAPSLIYEEGSLLRRAVRDMYIRDIEDIIVDGDQGYKEVKTFMKDMVPSHAKKVQPYKTKDYPLFYRYKIERQIEQMYSMHVSLKSGGYIIINPTEALVSIDVNSGKATRERHIDETALNTNLEAAEEVARQVRLRDLAGLIVIDFIDMNDPRHNHQVEKKLKESLTFDRARVQVGRISQFGLLEMSRQRLRPSIVESSTVVCAGCSGAGFVRSSESFALQLLRVLEEICLENIEMRQLTVHMPAHLAFYLLRDKRHELSSLEERYKLGLELKEDDKISAIGFRIESKGRFITDGVGNLSKHEEQKDVDGKEEGKKKKEFKKPKDIKDPRAAKEQKAVNVKMNPKKELLPSLPPSEEAPLPSNEPSVIEPSGDESQKSRSTRRRHRRNRRNKRGDNVAATVSVGETGPISPQPAVSKPSPSPSDQGRHKKKSSEKKSVEGSLAEAEKTTANAIIPPVQKSNGEDTFSSPSKSTPQAGKRKSGWWQRLLD